jgi:hypothetical protein
VKQEVAGSRWQPDGQSPQPTHLALQFTSPVVSSVVAYRLAVETENCQGWSSSLPFILTQIAWQLCDSPHRPPPSMPHRTRRGTTLSEAAASPCTPISVARLSKATRSPPKASASTYINIQIAAFAPSASRSTRMRPWQRPCSVCGLP